MNDGKFEPADLKIEKLGERHLGILKQFKCSENELEKFLIEDALNNQKQKISLTYLWFSKDSGELLSYITLLADAINLNEDLKSIFREKGIHYKSLPAIKVGRMAVGEKFMRKGLGSLMIEFATAITSQIADEKIGCRFIVVDAKRHMNPKLDAIHFYKKLSFAVLKERGKGTTAMYFDAISTSTA